MRAHLTHTVEPPGNAVAFVVVAFTVASGAVRLAWWAAPEDRAAFDRRRRARQIPDVRAVAVEVVCADRLVPVVEADHAQTGRGQTGGCAAGAAERVDRFLVVEWFD